MRSQCVCECVRWNVSQYKCHYFSTHFFLRQKNLPNSNAQKCIDLAKLPNSGDRLSIFLTNFFPFRKFDTVVCATNECAGECMQNPLAFTKEYTRFYSLSREITTAVLFSCSVLLRHFSKYSVCVHIHQPTKESFNVRHFFCCSLCARNW